MPGRSHLFETPGPVLVRLAVPEGDLVVEATDTAQVAVEASPLRGSGEAVDALRIEACERAGRHEIVVEAPSGRFGLLGRRAAVAVRVVCPIATALEVAAAAADLRARGRLGAVDVRTASGDVAIEAAASLHVESASGDVIVREVEGDATLKTTSGDVLAHAIGGSLTAALVSGDVQVESLAGDLRVSTVSGDVEVRELGGAATVNGVSGDVDLAVVAGRRLWLDVRSASGDVDSDLDVGDEPATGEAPVVELTVRTVSGDVRIRRSSRHADGAQTSSSASRSASTA